MKLEGACHCGRVSWKFDGLIESATACNCTSCRRYGALWAYGYVGKEIEVNGPTAAYDKGGKGLDFHFCEKCACVTHWLGKKDDEEGRRRIAVNLRLVKDPDTIGHFLIDHFDGFDKFEDEPRDGRTIKDMWY